MNPFGPWNSAGAAGFCYNGADSTTAGANIEFDNLNYMAWLIRDYNTGGDSQEIMRGNY